MTPVERIGNSSLTTRPSRTRREVVGRRPVAGAVLGPEIVAVALEGFEQHGGVAIILVADLVEIVPATVHGEVAAPVIRHALVDRGAPGIEALEPVGTGAERRLQRRLRSTSRFAPVRRRRPPTNASAARDLADDLRQFAVVLLREGEGDLALAGLLRLRRRSCSRRRNVGLFAFRVSKEKITSAAVTGLPSCQRASGRRR